MNDELIYKELTFKIRRCLMTVYNKLGPGFREETYKRAVIKELSKNNIPFDREKIITVKYDEETIDEYRVDLIGIRHIKFNNGTQMNAEPYGLRRFIRICLLFCNNQMGEIVISPKSLILSALICENLRPIWRIRV